MALASTTVRVAYDGDGSTVAFPTTFIFWDDADIQAILRAADGTETIWVLGTQYTLSGGDGSTGTLTVSTSPTDYTPAAGTKLVIKSARANKQTTEFPLGGQFPSTNAERALDQSVRLIQQRQEEIDRSVKLQATSAVTSVTIPDPVARRSLVWHPTEERLINSEQDPDAVATLAQDWATKTDGQVASTDFSSKAYAIGGTGVTGAAGAAKEWAVTTGSAIDGGTGFSSKEHAVGDLTTSGGSAKAWAVDASSPDGTTNKSAKTYAGEAETAKDAAVVAKDEAETAAANLPNASTAGSEKFLRTNAAGDAWEYRTAENQRTALGLGTAATKDVGTAATNVLQADQTEASTATATTTALGTATLRHLLTGTTTVEGFTGTAGVMYTCRAEGAFLLTHNATDLIITQTGASITTAAGDTFQVQMITGSTCRIVNFVRGSGEALVGGAIDISTVRVRTANGYGSTNDKIKRFSTVQWNEGDDITYADSATLGASFTINTAGVYSISFMANYNAGATVGISVNSTQLTTTMGGVAEADALCSHFVANANAGVHASALAYLSVGDVVRPHTSGIAAGGQATGTNFTIARVV